MGRERPLGKAVKLLNQVSRSIVGLPLGGKHLFDPLCPKNDVKRFTVKRGLHSLHASSKTLILNRLRNHLRAPEEHAASPDRPIASIFMADDSTTGDRAPDDFPAISQLNANSQGTGQRYGWAASPRQTSTNTSQTQRGGPGSADSPGFSRERNGSPSEWRPSGCRACRCSPHSPPR